MDLIDDNEALPAFKVDENNDRPWVKPIATSSEFRPGAEVYVRISATRKEGPYTIETVKSPQKYTLCLADGTSAKGGKVYDEKDLLEGKK